METVVFAIPMIIGQAALSTRLPIRLAQTFAARNGRVQTRQTLAMYKLKVLVLMCNGGASE
jgi:hypothetical protein